MSLTPKREAFAMAYVETGNASEAYRRAFNVRPNTKQEAIAVNASKLLADANVSLRVDELKAQLVKRHEITVDDLIAELDEAQRIALEAPKPQTAAAVSAILGKAKLLGFMVDRLDARIVAAALPGSVAMDDLA